MLENLALGFSVAFSLQNLLFCFVGALLGTSIGVLPGIGPVATIALLLPFTFGIPPESAIIMLAGIFYGAQYGGSTTSILVNLPGEVSSVVTTIDGYQMARVGRAGEALAVSAIGSFIAGIIATIVVAVLGASLTVVALAFQPADYFSLLLLGLLISSVLTHGSVVRSIAMVALGVALGLVGNDIDASQSRYTFGISALNDGIGFVPLSIGLFGIAEILRNLANPEIRGEVPHSLGRMWLTRDDWKRVMGPILRGSLFGSFIGVLPGGGAAIAALGAYALERRISPNKDQFGKGAIEGVAAPESANNAAAQTSFIPLLGLGIPGNAVTALVLGALIVHGLQPGPRMISEQPGLFWGVIVSMLIGNVILLIINLPLIGIWVRAVRIPYTILFPSIVVFCLIGTFSVNNSAFDVLLVAIFGVMGFFLTRWGFQPAPLLIGFVLGPLLEEFFRRAMSLSRGDPSVFVTRPISATLLVLLLIIVLVMALPNLRRAKDRALEE